MRGATVFARVLCDVKRLPIGPVEGFVLSQIDDHSTLEEIAEISGLGLAEVTRHARRLLELGAIELAGGHTQRKGDSSRTPAARNTKAPPSLNTKAPIPRNTKVPPSRNTKVPIPRNTKPPPSRHGLGARDATLNDPQTSGRPGRRSMRPPISQRPAVEPCELDEAARKKILELDGRLAGLDHYALLGVERDAEKAAIKRAYFALAGTFHPDRYFGKKLGELRAPLDRIFTRLTAAHDALTHRKQRAEYDATLSPHVPAAGRSRTVRPSVAEEAQPRSTRAPERSSKDAAPSSKAPASLRAPRRSTKPPHSTKPQARRPPSRAKRMSRAIAAVQQPPPVQQTPQAQQQRPPPAPLAQPLSPPAQARPAPQPAPPPPRQPEPPREIVKRDATPSFREPPLRVDSARRPPLVDPSPLPPREGAPGGAGPRIVVAGGAVEIRRRVDTFVRVADEAIARDDLVSAATFLRLALENSSDPVLRAKLKAIEGEAKERLRGKNVSRGNAAERKEEWAEAASCFAKAHAAVPDPSTAERAANAMRRAGADLRRAEQLAREAVLAEPNNAAFRVTLGEIYLEAKMFARAAGEAARAIALAPRDPRAVALSDAVEKANR